MIGQFLRNLPPLTLIFVIVLGVTGLTTVHPPTHSTILHANALPANVHSLPDYANRLLLAPLLSPSFSYAIISLVVSLVLLSEVERTAGGAGRLGGLLALGLTASAAMLVAFYPPWSQHADLDETRSFFVGQASLLGAVSVALAQAKVPHAGPSVTVTPGVSPSSVAGPGRPTFVPSALWRSPRRVFLTVAGSSFVILWPTGWAVQWFPALLGCLLTLVATVTGTAILWTAASFTAGAWCAWFHLRFREVSGGLRGDARDSMALGAFAPGATLGGAVDQVGTAVYAAALAKGLISAPTGPPVALLAMHESPAPQRGTSRRADANDRSTAHETEAPAALDRRRRLAAAALARLEDGDAGTEDGDSGAEPTGSASKGGDAGADGAADDR
mmetsp:Transcript_559/g.1721  ORF Transcript_559/g.1721 Transcript_559/m.1721 type:complete len:387 (-) Transcript_559:156-1316(-)